METEGWFLSDASRNSWLQRFILRWSGVALVTLAVLSLVGVWLGQRLQLKLSLTDLLPPDHPSVVKFDKITNIVGGVGYLIVVLQAEDGKSHERVAPALIKELQKSDLVRTAFTAREEYFFSSRMLYYLTMEDLNRLEESVTSSIRRSKRKVFDIGLWDEEENGKKGKPVDPKIKDAAKKAAAVTPNLESEDGKSLLVMIKPTFDSTDLDKTKALVALTHRILEAHLPAEVKAEIAGRYHDKIADSEVIEQDIFILGILALVAIGACMLFYCTPRAVIMIAIPVLMGVGLTLGAAYLFIGHINIVTGFLLGILTGLGLDYSIHLALRLRLEAKEPSSNHPDPTWRALSHSGHAIFVGAMSGALAFYLLCFSDFRAFSEFGFICGTGMIAVMVCLLLSFPALAKLFRMHTGNFSPSRNWSFRLPMLRSKWAFAAGLAVTVVLMLGAVRVGFEYDFSKMLLHSPRVQYLNQLVNEVYGRSPSPSVLAVPTKEEALALEEYIKEKYVPDVIQTMISGASIVPENQPAKQAVLTRVGEQIASLRDKWLEQELDIPGETIRRWVAAKPFTFEDLPVHLQDLLRGKSHSYYFLYVYPNFKVDLSTASGVYTFAAMVRDVEAKFPSVLSGSDAVVFAEILDLIQKDGLKILAAILVMVGVLIWVNFRNARATATSYVPLLVAFPVGMGLMALLGIKFNIFNIAIIPSFVAIGIDVPIHITQRARETRSGFKAAQDLASAINLALLTSALGFGVLVFSRAGVLRSLGWLALLGTLAIWWVGLFVLPAILERFYGREGMPRDAAAPGVPALAEAPKKPLRDESVNLTT